MRKEERIKRFAEFKQLLNSFMAENEGVGDHDSSSESSVESMESMESEEDFFMEKEKQEMKTAQKPKVSADNSEEEPNDKSIPPQDLCVLDPNFNPFIKKAPPMEDSVEGNLDVLDPWAKFTPSDQ